MKRDIYQTLVNWKQSEDRKPLILRGARQVGKTYILKEFGKKEYKHVAYFNFEEDKGLCDFFKGRISPQNIIEKLSIYQEEKIVSGDTLLIFDEIQDCPEAITSLKYFQENAKDYHLVVAGSLLGLKVGQSTPFPVGKVTFLDLHPFSFGEFLEGIGKTGLRQYLRQKRDFEPIEAAFHEELIFQLRLYLYIGGMAEAIKHYSRYQDLEKVRAVQKDILLSYPMDFSKHTSKPEAIKITGIWKAIPGLLAKENKKFKFTEISKHARARDYLDSIQWLVDSGLVHKVYNVKTPKFPLSGYKDENSFKLYLFDTGLLGAMLDLSQKTIVLRSSLFSEYSGAFTENYVAQELLANGFRELFYWTSQSSAEVDFILSFDEKIYPLEVKSGMSRKKKSLRIYGEKYQSEVLSRATPMNFKHDGNIRNYPLYAVSLFPMRR